MKKNCNRTSAPLPDGFSQLEPFVKKWGVAGLGNRAALRAAMTEAERQEFYETVKEQLIPILDHLGTKPVAEFNAGEAALLNLALSFAHISLAVEVQGPAEALHADMRHYMRITRAPDEVWNEKTAAS